MTAPASVDKHAHDVVIEVDAICDGVRASATGTVVSASEMTAALVGMRVLVGALAPCGDCDVCRRGGASACPVAARHALTATADGHRLTTSGRWLVALANGLDLPVPAAASVAGDVAVAYTLYARSGIGPRDPVVVVGSSSVARFVVEIIAAKGATPVVVVASDAAAGWRDWLLAKGVTAIPHAGDSELRASIAAAFTAQDVPGKPWCVIAVDDVALAASLAGPRATLTVLAPRGEAPAFPADVFALEVTIVSVAEAHPDLVVEAAAMCVKREIDLVAGTTTEPGDSTRSLVRSR